MWRRKTAKGDLVHSVSIAEFNIDVGNTLTVRCPDSELPGHSAEQLANLCLPDGAHLHDEDWTYLRLQVPLTEKEKKKAAESKEGGGDDDMGSDYRVLYGLAYYRNKRDASEKRGYIQKALLLLSPFPYFNVFLPLMRVALTRHLEKKDKASSIAKTLFTTLNKSIQKHLQITLWGEDYPINVPNLKTEDEFGGTSLVDLVTLFKEDTMLLWYALLLRKRILFVGQPAHAVGNCVLSAPMLVSPLSGFAPSLFPYVSLYDTSFTTSPAFIAGATNLLFEMKSGWADMTASFSTGSIVHDSGIRIAGSDRSLIKNVLSGIADNKGESWVREQFKNYTAQFLESMAGECAMRNSHKRYLSETFKSSALWLKHTSGAPQRQRSSTAAAGPMEFLRVVKDPETPILHRTKAFYHLDRLLDNLAVVEQVLHADGLSAVVPFLSDESSQVRKYAVSILAQLAISVEGQMSIVFQGLVGTVVNMLQDPMPNVASAACNCLYKMSTLYIGVLHLIEHRVPEKMVSIIVSPGDNLKLKHTAAKALLQMYRHAATGTLQPLAPVPFYEQLAIPDRPYRGTITLLLDLCKHPVPGIGVSKQMKQHLTALNNTDFEMRTEATSYLITMMVSKPELVFELIEGGGVETLYANLQARSSEYKLARLCFSALALVGDTHAGCQKFARLDIISAAVNALDASNPLFLSAAVRFIEVIAQHEITAVSLYESNMVAHLVDFVYKYSKIPNRRSLCLPALSALKHLTLTLPEMKVRIRDRIQKLGKLHRKIEDPVLPTTNSTTTTTTAMTTEEEGVSLDLDADSTTPTAGTISVATFLSSLPHISTDRQLETKFEQLLTLLEDAAGVRTT